MRASRRTFLRFLGGAAIGAATGPVASAASGRRKPAGVLVDMHTHLFGIGDGGTGCVLSCKQRAHWNFQFLLKLIGLAENGHMDEDYVQWMVRQLRASSVDRAVLQAWDCRYDSAGRQDLAHTTSLYVPNEYLFRIVRRYPDLFIPCASITPARRDALDEIDRCAAAGARLVKVHPPTMAVDPADPRFLPFYRRCADRGLIVMVHTGTEHSADIIGQEVADPARLRPALEAGCLVIAAHAGTRAFFDREDFYPHFREMIRRYPRLYCDTAVLASMFRFRVLPQMLRDDGVMERAVHGSDIPFPANAMVFWHRLRPADLISLVTEANLFERDWKLKRALGVPDAVFARGAALIEAASG